MNIEDLLHDDEAAILDDALPRVAGMEHYRRDGEAATRERLEVLYRQVVRAVSARDLDGLLAHAARIAQERYVAGFELAELHGAFATLEDAISRRAIARLPLEELAWGLALVGTALAHARSELGRAFTSAARPTRSACVDLTPIFRRGEPRRADDLVYPV